MKKNIITAVISIVVLTIYFFDLNNSFKPKNIVIEDNNISFIDKNDNKQTLEEEEYIKGVVACEMPASFNLEALKAQAIASRTYLYNELKNNKTITDDDQCFINEEEQKKKWGSDYNKYKSIINKAVDNTKDIVMNKDNKLFKPFYFSTSNGYTEDSMEVFSELSSTSVDSSFDKKVKNYKVDTKFTYNELTNILGKFKDIKIMERNKTNHVSKVKVDNKEYTGIEFRKLLSLRSTDFNIDKENQTYIITTYGYGHGVGMSQYGADYLGDSGYDAEYILKYYYQNIKLVSINKS